MNRSRIRKIMVYLIYIVMAVILQTSWPSTMLVAGVRPDLALILTVAAGFLYGEEEGAIIGLCCGFLLDAQSGRLLGLGMLLLMLNGMLPSMLMRAFPRRPLLVAPAVVAVGTIGFHTTVYVLSWLFPVLSDLVRNPYNLSHIVIRNLVPLVALNGALALPAAALLRYVGPYRRKPLEVIE